MYNILSMLVLVPGHIQQFRDIREQKAPKCFKPQK